MTKRVNSPNVTGFSQPSSYTGLIPPDSPPLEEIHQNILRKIDKVMSSGWPEPMEQKAGRYTKADATRIMMILANLDYKLFEILALEMVRADKDHKGVWYAIIDHAYTRIWTMIEGSEYRYILTTHEFCIFNYFQHRFKDNERAQIVRQSYWNNTEGKERGMELGAASTKTSEKECEVEAFQAVKCGVQDA